MHTFYIDFTFPLLRFDNKSTTQPLQYTPLNCQKGLKQLLDWDFPRQKRMRFMTIYPLRKFQKTLRNK